jgi:SAM-dependent methyltransferase
MGTGLSITKGTFRDPEGQLYEHEGHILREIYPQHVDSVLSWIRSPLAQRWVEQGRMVPTKVLIVETAQRALLEHERIFFPTYPWEWSPSQWIDAASLTLSLCEEAVDEGFILKDATPLNVLFSGSRAIFVDVLSFERRDPQNPLWLAYAQFVRTFLLPLCAHVHLGWPLSATQQRRDGYEPADLKPFLPFLRSWLQPLRSLVALPLLLQQNVRVGAKQPRVSEDVSAFALHRLLRSTRMLLQSLAPIQRRSRWSHYTKTAMHYDPADQAAKQEFVRSTLDRIKPVRVLDVGANTGVYSRIAAESGAQVVAWDTDVQATDINWQTARRNGLSILSVVADFARPTPAVGWRNQESASLLDRARGQFDCVLTLGVLHHLLIVDQIPLAAIVGQLSEITTRWLIVEWIPQGDSQFVELCRGRDEIYRHLSEEHFVRTLFQSFAICKRVLLPNGRTLFLGEKLA